MLNLKWIYGTYPHFTNVYSWVKICTIRISPSDLLYCYVLTCCLLSYKFTYHHKTCSQMSEMKCLWPRLIRYMQSMVIQYDLVDFLNHSLRGHLSCCIITVIVLADHTNLSLYSYIQSFRLVNEVADIVKVEPIIFNILWIENYIKKQKVKI